MSANPIPDAKPLKGKYDGRRFNGRKALESKTGRKPQWAKHLAKNSAAHIFKTCDIRGKVIELLSSPDARLRFEVIRYVWDRLEGKPFSAVNPEASESKPAATDPRILVAIQNLIPGQQPTKSKRSKVIEATTVEAKALPAASAE